MSNKNINLDITANAWAEITVKLWLNKIKALQINDTGALLTSFIHQVISDTDGNPERIEIAFLYYGKFVNWGVGRGVKLPDVEFFGSINKGRRRPKQWYNTVFFSEISRLRELLEQKYALKAQIAIVNSLNKK